MGPPVPHAPAGGPAGARAVGIGSAARRRPPPGRDGRRRIPAMGRSGPGNGHHIQDRRPPHICTIARGFKAIPKLAGGARGNPTMARTPLDGGGRRQAQGRPPGGAILAAQGQPRDQGEVRSGADHDRDVEDEGRVRTTDRSDMGAAPRVVGRSLAGPPHDCIIERDRTPPCSTRPVVPERRSLVRLFRRLGASSP